MRRGGRLTPAGTLDVRRETRAVGVAFFGGLTKAVGLLREQDCGSDLQLREERSLYDCDARACVEEPVDFHKQRSHEDECAVYGRNWLGWP